VNQERPLESYTSVTALRSFAKQKQEWRGTSKNLPTPLIS